MDWLGIETGLVFDLERCRRRIGVDSAAVLAEVHRGHAALIPFEISSRAVRFPFPSRSMDSARDQEPTQS